MNKSKLELRISAMVKKKNKKSQEKKSDYASRTKSARGILGFKWPMNNQGNASESRYFANKFKRDSKTLRHNNS